MLISWTTVYCMIALGVLVMIALLVTFLLQVYTSLYLPFCLNEHTAMPGGLNLSSSFSRQYANMSGTAAGLNTSSQSPLRCHNHVMSPDGILRASPAAGPSLPHHALAMSSSKSVGTF